MSTTATQTPAGKAVRSRKRVLVPLAGLLIASAISLSLIHI